MKIFRLYVFGLLSIAVAVSAEGQKKKGTPFVSTITAADSAVYAASATSGTATLSGQAFLSTRGGDIKRGAGRLVTLDPVTDYSKQWFNWLGGAISKIGNLPPDRLFEISRRTTVSDADGKFSFSALPPGTYLVRTSVTWEIPSELARDRVQGGTLESRVTLGAGETRSVILNSH